MSMNRRSRVSSLRITIIVLGGVAIAGCGPTGHPSRTSTNATTASGLRFSQCMRANGAPNFPDPGPNGFPIRPGSSILNSPAGQNAFNACTKYLPYSGSLPPTPESVRRQELLLANCMRANGVPSFPDPNAQGNIQFPITSRIPQSPAFRRASNGPCKKHSDVLSP
jgi:hypothetical protein